MYRINVTLTPDREIKLTSFSGGITGENNSSTLRITVPDEYSSYTKYLDIYKENGEKTQTVVSVSDEKECSYVLPGKFTENLNVYMQLVLKKGSSVFKSYRFVLTFEEGINATSRLESEYQDSIQRLYEIKADKSEVAEVRKGLENKLSVKMFFEEKNLLLNQIYSKPDFSDIPGKLSELENDFDYVSDKNYVHTDNNFSDEMIEKLEGKAEKSELPQTISELSDDTSVTPVKRALLADKAKKAENDGEGNIISETYAKNTKLGVVEIGNIKSADELKAYVQPGIFSFNDYSDTSIEPIIKSSYGKGLLFNCVYSEENVMGTGGGLSRLTQYIFYPEKGVSYKRTATRKGGDFWNAVSSEYTWEELELRNSINQTGELIEEIVITDENNAKDIKRNSEPDGTPYNFKAMIVYYEIKPCAVQNLVIFKVYDGASYSDSNMLTDYQGNCTATTSGRYVQAYFDVFSGLWIGIGNATTIQGSPTTLQGWRMNHSALYTGQRIKSLSITSNTSDMFEVGSVIRIYGVR